MRAAPFITRRLIKGHHTLSCSPKALLIVIDRFAFGNHRLLILISRFWITLVHQRQHQTKHTAGYRFTLFFTFLSFTALYRLLFIAINWIMCTFLLVVSRLPIKISTNIISLSGCVTPSSCLICFQHPASLIQRTVWAVIIFNRGYSGRGVYFVNAFFQWDALEVLVVEGWAEGMSGAKPILIVEGDDGGWHCEEGYDYWMFINK